MTRFASFNFKFGLTTDKEKNKFCFSVITEYIKDVSEILAKNELSFSTGGKGDLALFLDDIYAISSKLFVNFNHELSDSEYEKSILPLFNSINELRWHYHEINDRTG
jgi:hypothetical protein